MNIDELFIKLLKFKSITPDDDGAFDFIDSYLDNFEIIKLDINGVKNRFYYKKGNSTHICFAGHIDVVPPGNNWDTDPFNPYIKDDLIIARGTQDMKSGVASLLYALKHSNTPFTISALLTSDEEGDAIYGTNKMLKLLKEKNLLPDFAIVAEPTCENIFGDTIKVGRRGSINGVLKIFGVQGHAAYPQKAINPIHQLAPILNKIAGYKLDNGDEFFSPSQIIITDIRGGLEVTNVTASDVKVMFNVRNSTKTTKESLENFIKENIDKNIKYELSFSQNSFPFITKDSKITKILSKIIENNLNIKPNLSTSGGTSDARFFASFGVDVIEFGVINDKIHSVNESTKLSYVRDLSKIFTDILEKAW